MDSVSFIGSAVLGKPLWFWLAFLGVVMALLALDLGVFNRKLHKPKFAESMLGTLFYMGISCLFGVFIWSELGAEKSLEYFTGYVMEMSLSMDNVFVISLIFSSLSIPAQYQHRVLFWGILSVLILRGIMIGAGVALIHEFHWILAVFGAFLLFSGLRMLFTKPSDEDVSNNKLLIWMRKHLRITKELHGTKFFVTAPARSNSKKNVLWVTPLFVVLILVEVADVVFAVDSVPAVFAITQDPYIVYTSNIFAILGLRTLYFTLAAMVHRFEYLSKALAIVLIFIGGKIMAAELTGYDLPIQYSLGMVLLIILSGIGFSLYKTQNEKKA
jgi:tellurite resistance protein TerC